MMPAGPAALSPLRLGYACSWWLPREPTWFYTPVSLRAGLLAAGVEVLDIEAQPPLRPQAVLELADVTTPTGRPSYAYQDWRNLIPRPS